MVKWEVFSYISRGGLFSVGEATIHFFIASGLNERINIGEVDPLDLDALKAMKKRAAEVAAEMNESPTYP